MRTLLTFFLASLGTSAMAQNFDPPPAKTPDAATLKLITERTAKLKDAAAEMEADVQIFAKAAEWIVRHDEWFTADSAKQTLAVLDEGFRRVEGVNAGNRPWRQSEGQMVARGYESNVDGSLQPYGVIYPHGYGRDKNKKWRLDVHLHGRDSSLTEVKHLFQHLGKPAPKDQDFVQLNIYGRGNNAYRWAGETDVIEVLERFVADESDRYLGIIDKRHVVLKGFSMGGAGTWHIGLRHPGRFAAIQPGAGFTTTHGYIAKLPEALPDYQEKCLRIYDAYRYAENAFNVPVIAYSGEVDKQKAAADLIESELRRLKLSDRITHLVAPGLEHKYPPEWQKKVAVEVDKYAGAGKQRNAFPERIRFATYHLGLSGGKDCDWIYIAQMERQYELARIDATRNGNKVDVKTENVRDFILDWPSWEPKPEIVTIDGATFDRKALGNDIGAQFLKRDGRWHVWHLDLLDNGPRKEAARNGPIDDAFRNRFLCVVGTGRPFHEATEKAARAQLERFRREWDKYLRGTLVVVKDTDVTEHDMRWKNLILFGDPSSNSLIAKALPNLPFKWTANKLVLGGAEYDPSTHMPMLVYPNPFGSRYVVLNSGHTFHEADFKGTNALLYPRLGDYAVVKPTPNAKDPAAFEVLTAGLFEETWQFPKK
jgi:pimeloyl-ACP methyl ester carboxylesterase